MRKVASTNVTITEACAHPKLFGPWFKGDSWAGWLAFLAVLFGLPLTAEQLDTFHRFTGRSLSPNGAFVEAWICVGRRAGKSFIAALIAVFLVCFRDYTQFLGPGEIGTVVIIAADRRQARTILRFVKGLVEAVPMLRSMLVNETKESLEFNNRTCIEIHTASFKTVRGYTLIAALCDEVSFWAVEDSANPDREILNALRPALATIPGAPLLCLSSPHARRGELWNAFKQYYGKNDSPILFWRAATRDMNPTVPERVIREAFERDPAAASAEYGAEFRTDVEGFVSREAVEACVISGRLELPRIDGIRYIAFVDPSGGSGDSMTLAVAHRDANGKAVLDCLRERRPPFSPDGVTREFAETLRTYGISTVTGDRYAGEWPRERFRVHGIHYKPSEMSKSDFYLTFLPLLNSGQAELLDHPRLLAQLTALERRTSRGGRDTVDHPPMAHDDLINAAAGALVLTERNTGGIVMISRNGRTLDFSRPNWREQSQKQRLAARFQ